MYDTSLSNPAKGKRPRGADTNTSVDVHARRSSPTSSMTPSAAPPPSAPASWALVVVGRVCPRWGCHNRCATILREDVVRAQLPTATFNQ